MHVTMRHAMCTLQCKLLHQPDTRFPGTKQFDRLWTSGTGAVSNVISLPVTCSEVHVVLLHLR